jgi:hypothetical protein
MEKEKVSTLHLDSASDFSYTLRIRSAERRKRPQLADSDSEEEASSPNSTQ